MFTMLCLLSICYALSAPEDHGRYYGGRSWHIGDSLTGYVLAILAVIFIFLMLICTGTADKMRKEPNDNGNLQIGCGVVGIILAVLLMLIRCSMDK